MKLSELKALWRAASLVLLLGFIPSGEANIFESILMPGEVIRGHAEIELECKNCHESFEQENQRPLCLNCHDHQPIADDIKQGEGFHGKMENSQNIECRVCHSDHLGRDADIIQLIPATFNHELTDFPLKGAHQSTACGSCHETDKLYREAPAQCFNCHEEDDAHSGKLGEECADCHKATGWKETAFDHDDTDFPLKDKHQDVSCSSCHADEHYEDTATECVACHLLNDAHGGFFGNKCESCHSEKDWDKSIFNHNQDTEFKLNGKHKTASCKSCHKKPPLEKAPPDQCIDCHKSDDVHQQKNGTQCQDCHSETNWQKSSFDHKRDTDFELRGKHKELACDNCHKGSLDEELESGCINCHKADDVHLGQQGDACENCHSEQSFSDQVRFDHDLTRFPLIGQHAITSCEECHLEQTFKDTALNCVNCHQDDDTHKQGLGSRCETCHTPNEWGIWQFDHNTQTDFELTGKHKDQPCAACHIRPVAAGEEIDQAADCYSCHRSDDTHFGGFGRFCERCHNTESFSDTTKMNK